MKTTMFQQFDLESDDKTMTVWLESGKVKEGYKITLKDGEDAQDWWTVKKEYDLKLERAEIKDSHDSIKWHEKDHHTKLMGLDIKK